MGEGTGEKGCLWSVNNYLLSGCCNGTSSISAISRIQNAVSQFLFSSQIQQGLCVSQIVISLTYHPSHVKTEC
jgi:hypothetical protein